MRAFGISVWKEQVPGLKPFEPLNAEARLGDPPQARASALSNLFREHNCTLVRFINARLRNEQEEQEANEIAQEAYVKMLQLDRCPGTPASCATTCSVAENLTASTGFATIRSPAARSTHLN